VRVRRRKVEPVDVSMSDLKGLIKGSVLVVIASVTDKLTTRDLEPKQHRLFWGYFGEGNYCASADMIRSEMSDARRERDTYNANNTTEQHL
jgi:hypothetical protein